MPKSKLKRDRAALGRGDQHPAGPSPEAAEGRVELRRPTPEEPALRRYVPAASPDAGSELFDAGALDWRDERSADPELVEAVVDRVICGDSERVLARLPEGCVACVITSPPYWNTVDYGFPGQLGATGYEAYLEQLLGVWRECERVLAPNGKLCINAPILPIPKALMPDQHTRHLKNLNNDIEATILGALSLQRYSLYLWQKQTTEKMFGSYPHPPNLYEQNTVEFIAVYVKPGKPKRLPKAVKEASRLTEKQWMNLTRQVWNLYPQDIKRARHPAPFPEALPNRLIAMYTFAAYRGPEGASPVAVVGRGPVPRPPSLDFPGDIVLDPFCGTGATCVAAKRLGRRFIGIDLSPDFATEAARRVSAAKQDGEIALCDLKKASARPKAGAAD